MEHAGVGSHRWVSFTRIDTGRIFLLGGLRTLGEATTEAITGGTSVTVTEVEQKDWFPEASVAVHDTGVVPKPKEDPDEGTQLEVTAGQLSETVGVIVADAPERLVQLIDVGAGQEMLGFCMSF